MKSRVLSFIASVVAVCVLFAAGFWTGFGEGVKRPQRIVVEGVANAEGEAGKNFDIFWQVWDLLQREHLKGNDWNTQDRIYGAISGLVQSLHDPYSEFFSPDDSKSFYEDVLGQFGGIGAEIGTRNDQIVVVAPLEGGPAMRAGLLPKDRIVAINATSTEGMTVLEAVQHIRGPEGEPVTLTILRDSWERPKDIDIVREIIEIPTLDADFVEDGIYHVKLYGFNANADSLFYTAMLEGLLGGAKGLVLDLRNNPGGFLQVAVDLAGWFFPRGTGVVSEEWRDGMRDELKTTRNGALQDLPVVVLINGGSASASEILAGALHDVRNIPLVGETSFGKGTVQDIENLTDGSSLKITVARWVLPGGAILEGNGLVPDYDIPLTEDDIAAERDPQLEKAVEVLRSEIEKY